MPTPLKGENSASKATKPPQYIQIKVPTPKSRKQPRLDPEPSTPRWQKPQQTKPPTPTSPPEESQKPSPTFLEPKPTFQANSVRTTPSLSQPRNQHVPTPYSTFNDPPCQGCVNNVSAHNTQSVILKTYTIITNIHKKDMPGTEKIHPCFPES